MSLIYTFAASPMEGEPVRKIGSRLPVDSHYRCGGNEVVLFTGAMGPLNARETAALAFSACSRKSEKNPDLALSIGLCGGLSTLMPEGAVVAYEECLSTEDHSSPLLCSSTLTNSVAVLLEASGIHCARVVGITSPRIATRPNERLMLAKRGAVVVDMESYSILRSAAAADIPTVVLRAISDTVDQELPDFNKALNDRGGLDGRKALMVALGSPWSTAKLLAGNRRAMQRLTNALEIVLKADCFPSRPIA